ncbi:MAG: hypothetical protein HY063_12440 [Bacteroidetes bacterium]|nr:hypothetical protein [Bacteroidota bacterium]
MSNHSLLETIEKQISDIEGKLQKQMKEPNNSNAADIKEWLKFLHEKRKEIMKRSNEE